MQSITCPACQEDHREIYGSIAEKEKDDDDDFDDDNIDDFIDDDIHDYVMIFDNKRKKLSYQSMFSSPTRYFCYNCS